VPAITPFSLIAVANVPSKAAVPAPGASKVVMMPGARPKKPWLTSFEPL